MFYLNNDVCVPITKIDNCDNYNVSVNSCSSCVSEYVLINNACFP